MGVLVEYFGDIRKFYYWLFIIVIKLVVVFWMFEMGNVVNEMDVKVFRCLN